MLRELAKLPRPTNCWAPAPSVLGINRRDTSAREPYAISANGSGTCCEVIFAASGQRIITFVSMLFSVRDQHFALPDNLKFSPRTTIAVASNPNAQHPRMRCYNRHELVFDVRPNTASNSL
jgi:hypothetical protein